MLSLFKKLPFRLILTILVLTGGALSIAWFVSDQREQSKEGLIAFYEIQLDLLAQKAQTTSFSRRGDEEVQRTLDACLHTGLEIAYAYLHRRSGTIHTFDGAFPEALLLDERELSDEISVDTIELGENVYYDFARLYSVRGESSIHIGVPAHVIDNPSIAFSPWPGYIVAALSIIAVISALYFIHISRPAQRETHRPIIRTSSRNDDPLWREMFLNSPSAMVLFTSESGKIREANRVFADLCGQHISGLKGQNINEYLLPSDHEDVPLNMIDDVEPESTVYLKQGRRGVMALHAEAQQFYIGEELCQLVSAFDVSSLLNRQQSLRSERNEQSSRAIMDRLTRLFNRLGIEAHAEAELNRAERGEPMSLMLIDIDNFKKINDTYGHDAGDRVLVRLAEIMVSTKRTYDWAGRWGGEEFLILLPGTGLHQAAQAAERLRVAVSTQQIHVSRGKDLAITISIGVVSTEKTSAGSLNLNKLVKAADEALYEAKESGKNKTVVFSEGRLLTFKG